MLCLFAHRLLHRDGNRNGCADHGVIAHADETHHLDVRGDGGGAGELRVGMHPAHGVRHAVGSGARRHVIGMERSARAAARRNGEVLLAVLHAPLLIRARDGMLEARGVGGVARDGDVHALVTHYRDALGDVVRAIALYLRLIAVGIRLFKDDL